MKKLFRITRGFGCHLLEVVATIAILGIIAVFLAMPAATARADSQGYPQTYNTLTNVPATVSLSAVSNYTTWIPLRTGRGLGLMWKFNTSSPSTNPTGSSIVWIWPSVDGTNKATVAPWPWTVAQTNGVTDVVANTNWSAATLTGYTALIIDTYTNSSGFVTQTNKLLLSNIPNQ